MGIFGGDKNNQSAPSSDNGTSVPVSQTPSNLDGILPSAAPVNDAAMQHSVDSVLAQSTPSAEENAATADFIMTEPPAHLAQPAYPADEPSVADSFSPPEPTTSVPPAFIGGGEAADDLTAIKQQALQQLSPLVGHLNQSPEERFQTTMMMLQATDNQSLVRVAYEAAQTITDEKARAQALLDIVNEINYFTQQNKNNQQ